MTTRQEGRFARIIINEVIEVMQSDRGFADWFTNLPVQEQIRMSTVLMTKVKSKIRDMETEILTGRFDERKGE